MVNKKKKGLFYIFAYALSEFSIMFGAVLIALAVKSLQTISMTEFWIGLIGFIFGIAVKYGMENYDHLFRGKVFSK
jgi:hypothetical protein